jgi:hypothetical protein
MAATAPLLAYGGGDNMIIAEARSYRVAHDLLPDDIRVVDRATAELLDDALDAASCTCDDAVDREVRYYTHLTDAEQKTLESHRPSKDNPCCECAGNRVCVRHALIEIIDRLTFENYA